MSRIAKVQAATPGLEVKSPLKPLNRHCSDLCTILEYANQMVWTEVAEWLHVAASVKSVEVDTIQYDEGFGWCSHADEFAMSQETLLSEFVAQLTVFSFVWGGLESALPRLNIPSHPDKSKRGKIANACRHISRNYTNRIEILQYHEEVSLFRATLTGCHGYDKIDTRFAAVSEIGISGLGLYAVYVLRNKFAHGSLGFPLPDEENRPISGHVKLIAHATRIVLLSLQMLFEIYYKSSKRIIEFSWNSDFNREEYDVSALMRCFHMIRRYEPNQLGLFRRNQDCHRFEIIDETE
jgi:hypothetical protein